MLQPAEMDQQELPNFHREIELPVLIVVQWLYNASTVGTFKVLSSNKYEAHTRYRGLQEKLKEFKRKQVFLKFSRTNNYLHGKA